jgi:hypothetical protein
MPAATVHGEYSIVENVTAAREVKSGHLHLCPDGRVGYYGGTQTIANAGVIPAMETEVVLKIEAGEFAAIAAGQPANFNFTTQKLALSGGTNIGTYVKDKALNATHGIVVLNNAGQPLNTSQVPTTTAAPTTTTAGP